MKMLLSFMLCASICLGQPAKGKYPLIKFDDLSRTTADTVRVKAYIMDIYVCPDCPPGMICKPCIGNHFMAVEERPVDPLKISGEMKRRIYMDHPDKLISGKRYVLTIRFRNKSIRDELELVSFE